MTMVELLIVIGIFASVAILAIILMDPKKQIEKTWDTRRKNDLTTIGKSLEEYYNDKGVYPNDIICDDAGVEVDTDVCVCHICSLSNTNLPSYLKTKRCDPQYPNKKYLYKYDCADNASPQWYQICGMLTYPNNTDQRQESSYNYGTSSTNKKFTYCLSGCLSDDQGGKYCKQYGACNICGTYENCILYSRCDKPLVLYNNSNCTSECVGTIEGP